MKRHVLVLTFCACFLGAVFHPIAVEANPTAEQAPGSFAGTEGNRNSYEATISTNGRFVAFYSYASSLVPDDTNGFSDIFVRDRETETTERVSVSSTGVEANNDSYGYAISADGRFVSFLSDASNLVPDDTNNLRDVFVRDRQNNTTERVSVSSDGTEANGDNSDVQSISADGRFVLFYSVASNLVPDDTNTFIDAFVRDRQNNTTERISVSSAGIQGNANSLNSLAFSTTSAISADGRFVAFYSLSSNLVPDDTNNKVDIFVRDRQTNTTERVSISSTGTQANGLSSSPAMSADGRFVAFYSDASNLVTGDTNNTPDVFVRDRQTNTTERISVSSTGTQGNSSSYAGALSADGRFIAFYSDASNLVTGDTNNVLDVFVRDRQTSTTERVSLSSTNIQGNDLSNVASISADGRFVAFYADASNLVPDDANGFSDTFVRDRQTGSTERVSLSSTVSAYNHQSYAPAISTDGRFVAFASLASNLVMGDSNHLPDIFVRDQQTGSIERVSVSSAGVEANNQSTDIPAVSSDGRFVAFVSLASNLVPDDTNGTYDIFVRDRQNNTTERVSVSSAGIEGNNPSYQPAISADGRFVAFTSRASNLVTGDTNTLYDIFVHDRQTGSTERVSLNSVGAEVFDNNDHPSISADGRFVTFSSRWPLVPHTTGRGFQIYVRDRLNNTTERISLSSDGTNGNDQSYTSVISADGRFVAFWSYANNLVADDSNNTRDVFVRDRQMNTTERVSVSSAGTEGNGDSYRLALSADGRFVTFESLASNLVPSDTNNAADIFVRDRQTNTTERVSVSSDGTEGNNQSYMSAISTDGRFVTFESLASNLVSGDTNNGRDVFIRDRQNNTTERVSVGSVAPAAPILLAPADGLVTLNTKPVFTWSSVPDIDYYEMRLDTVNPPVKIVYSGSLLTYTPPSLLRHVTYYWQVAAVDVDGNISTVEMRTITINWPDNTVPPRNYFTISTPTLTWNSVSWAARYEIQVDDTLTFSSPLDFTGSVPADQLSVMTTSLANNTYYWHVRACPAAGACKAWSSTDSFVVDS